MFSDIFDVEARGQKTALDAPIAVGRIDVALVLIMAALAVYFFIYPFWRSQFLIEIWFTEGWNAYFTCASIETSVVARYIGPTWTRAAVIALLALRLIATDRQEPLLILIDPQFKNRFEAGEQSVQTETTQVAAIDGDVYCDIKIVCRLAGKAFAVDDFKVGQMLATKRLSRSDLDGLLVSRRITTFKNNAIGMGAVDTSLAHAIQRARTP